MGIQEIVDAARECSERHAIAEAELHKGLGGNYGYGRIENAEIASFAAGAEFGIDKIIDESCQFWFDHLKGFLGEGLAKNCVDEYRQSITLK